MAVSAAFAPGTFSGCAFSCRSSVVEHLIGNEEVHSSILCGSTIFPCFQDSARTALVGLIAQHFFRHLQSPLMMHLDRPLRWRKAAVSTRVPSWAIRTTCGNIGGRSWLTSMTWVRLPSNENREWLNRTYDPVHRL